MPKINGKKMKTALLYLDTRSRGSTSRCCRIVHAKNVALSGAIYTLVSHHIPSLSAFLLLLLIFTIWCSVWFIHNLTSEKLSKTFIKESFQKSHFERIIANLDRCFRAKSFTEKKKSIKWVEGINMQWDKKMRYKRAKVTKNGENVNWIRRFTYGIHINEKIANVCLMCSVLTC